jgi:hypothetical protein
MHVDSALLERLLRRRTNIYPSSSERRAHEHVAARPQTPIQRPQARTSDAWNQRLTAAVAPDIEYLASQPRPSQAGVFTVFMSPDGSITDKALLNAGWRHHFGGIFEKQWLAGLGCSGTPRNPENGTASARCGR